MNLNNFKHVFDFAPHLENICHFEPSDDLSPEENARLARLSIVIINVKQSTLRRENMSTLAHALKMNAMYFNAFDGTKMTLHETFDPLLDIIEYGDKQYFMLDYTRRFDYSLRGKLGKGMVGASLSHIMVYNGLQNSDCTGFVVLEDDALMIQDPAVIRKCLANLPDDYDMAYLNSESKWRPIQRLDKINDFYNDIKKQFFNASVSYVISVKGAGKLLAYTRNDVTRPPDDLIANAFVVGAYNVIASNPFLFGCDYSLESDTARFNS